MFEKCDFAFLFSFQIISMAHDNYASPELELEVVEEVEERWDVAQRRCRDTACCVRYLRGLDLCGHGNFAHVLARRCESVYRIAPWQGDR